MISLMISLERLYSRQCPKSLNAEQTARGAKPLTLDDILNIIGKVQSKYMVGSFVHEVRIALDKQIEKRLIAALAQQLSALNVEMHLAKAMAKTAVAEVCGTNICNKCHGTGQVYSKRHARLFVCKKCNGSCRVVKTHDELLRWINQELPVLQRIDSTVWRKRYYDLYMDCVDELHSSASDAAAYARKLLRKLEETWQDAA